MDSTCSWGFPSCSTPKGSQGSKVMAVRGGPVTRDGLALRSGAPSAPGRASSSRWALCCGVERHLPASGFLTHQFAPASRRGRPAVASSRIRAVRPSVRAFGLHSLASCFGPSLCRKLAVVAKPTSLFVAASSRVTAVSVSLSLLCHRHPHSSLPMLRAGGGGPSLASTLQLPPPDSRDVNSLLHAFIPPLTVSTHF